jgi:hypothetical protein
MVQGLWVSPLAIKMLDEIITTLYHRVFWFNSPCGLFLPFSALMMNIFIQFTPSHRGTEISSNLISRCQKPSLYRNLNSSYNTKTRYKSSNKKQLQNIKTNHKKTPPDGRRGLTRPFCPLCLRSTPPNPRNPPPAPCPPTPSPSQLSLWEIVSKSGSRKINESHASL